MLKTAGLVTTGYRRVRGLAATCCSHLSMMSVWGENFGAWGSGAILRVGMGLTRKSGRNLVSVTPLQRKSNGYARKISFEAEKNLLKETKTEFCVEKDNYNEGEKPLYLYNISRYAR